MIKIGLTGGIGSGKSTAAALFAEHGITVIDADALAREFTQPDSPYFKRIAEHFGPRFITAAGTLDRAKLRTWVFTHPEERIWLEKTLHPPILEQLVIRQQQAQGPYSIAVVPLLVEKSLMSYFNRVLVIDLPEELQKARLFARDNLSPDLLANMLNAQCSRKERLNAATDVLSNAGSIEDLKREVNRLHEYFIHLT